MKPSWVLSEDDKSKLAGIVKKQNDKNNGEIVIKKVNN